MGVCCCIGRSRCLPQIEVTGTQQAAKATRGHTNYLKEHEQGNLYSHWEPFPLPPAPLACQSQVTFLPDTRLWSGMFSLFSSKT